MSEEIREGFIRQRRNLMLMSVVVFFAQYVGLEFKQLSFLGNQASIASSSSVMGFLWLLFGYWFIRYLQYFHEISEQGGVGLIDKFMFKRNQGVLTRLQKKEVSDRSIKYIVVEVNPKLVDMEDVSYRLASCKVLHWRYFFGRVMMRVEVSAGSLRQRVNNVEINRRTSLLEVLVPTIKASVYIAFRTRLISEYILPVLLCFLPISYWLYAAWSP